MNDQKQGQIFQTEELKENPNELANREKSEEPNVNHSSNAESKFQPKFVDEMIETKKNDEQKVQDNENEKGNSNKKENEKEKMETKETTQVKINEYEESKKENKEEPTSKNDNIN